MGEDQHVPVKNPITSLSFGSNYLSYCYHYLLINGDCFAKCCTPNFILVSACTIRAIDDEIMTRKY